MCKCRFEAMEKIRENMLPEAESISLDHVEMLSGRTYDTASVRMPGQKKEKKINVLHQFCPFCGEKYPDA